MRYKVKGTVERVKAKGQAHPGRQLPATNVASVIDPTDQRHRSKASIERERKEREKSEAERRADLKAKTEAAIGRFGVPEAGPQKGGVSAG